MIKEYEDLILVEDVNGKICAIPKKAHYTIDDFLKGTPIYGFEDGVGCLGALKQFMDKKGDSPLGRTPKYVKAFLEDVANGEL